MGWMGWMWWMGYLTIVADAGALAPWGAATAMTDFVVFFPCLPCAHLPNWAALDGTDALAPCEAATAMTGISIPFSCLLSIRPFG